MGNPIKKVAIKVYVPSGDICEGATFKCPMLLDMSNIPACFCVLIPDSFWYNHERKTKNKQCPSLYHAKANKLSEDDIINHKLRLIKQCVKHGTLDQLTNKNNEDNE